MNSFVCLSCHPPLSVEYFSPPKRLRLASVMVYMSVCCYVVQNVLPMSYLNTFKRVSADLIFSMKDCLLVHCVLDEFFSSSETDPDHTLHLLILSFFLASLRLTQLQVSLHLTQHWHFWELQSVVPCYILMIQLRLYLSDRNTALNDAMFPSVPHNRRHALKKNHHVIMWLFHR